MAKRWVFLALQKISLTNISKLTYQASHDLLTGLPNHTAFDDCLNEAFSDAQQNGKLLVVMHLDLDGFKTVNDGLGSDSKV
ncbi:MULTISPECIES: GGDEF domain-containing protein [Halomonadaceae]|jgi:diguanylate cyclase (GGDEF)-like protein|uniref:Diguanylate cyclase (GGDEF) domain-containing protein n=1 Tax=Vreelandella subterranea TaxID=416874 RepID=A0A1H9RHT4_9GAMM|nr:MULTISPECIES: GGDEF domain-containing protein [Halomonas]MCO7246613.1 GGDEF domain-containing protein [Halomonas sp. Mc5H-6]QPL44965.1 GGDEF domain-containing protein [Halomonas sp. A40-4]SER71553.1 diguanylate cyclase (GGDEF) domain-containing protein [Halomonas subterranea]